MKEIVETKQSDAIPPRERRSQPLGNCMKIALEAHFQHLDGHPPDDLYKFVIGEVERSLLEVVMKNSGGNQSRAAKILGLNRATLRKKLKRYALD